MNEKQYCPTCRKKSAMEEKPFNWGEGIIVKAFHCLNCGEKLLSEKEHKKAARAYSGKKNTLTLSRQLFKLGHSLAVRIPLDVVQKLSLKPKQTVELYTNAGTIIVKPN